MDSAGRIVIPKSIRELAGLSPEVPIEIRYRDGLIELEPISEHRLVRRGALLVAEAESAPPPLTGEMVRDTMERLRRGEK
jgi:AbrB family looped-hinge helix DNA binding protein